METIKIPHVSWFYTETNESIKPWMKMTAAGILILVLVMIGMYWRTIGDNDASLYGFWEVDGDFADSAHLDAMYVFIHPPNGNAANSIGPGGVTLPIYILLKADGETKVNQVIRTSVARRSMRSDTIQKYKFDFGAPVSIIPKKIAAHYDPVTQMLILKDSKRTYARLFKKPEISFYCAGRPSGGDQKGVTRKTEPADVDDDDSGASEFHTDDADADADADAPIDD
jgi:hypothetical protein